MPRTASAPTPARRPHAVITTVQQPMGWPLSYRTAVAAANESVWPTMMDIIEDEIALGDAENELESLERLYSDWIIDSAHDEDPVGVFEDYQGPDNSYFDELSREAARDDQEAWDQIDRVGIYAENWPGAAYETNEVEFPTLRPKHRLKVKMRPAVHTTRRSCTSWPEKNEDVSVSSHVRSVQHDSHGFHGRKPRQKFGIAEF